MCRKYTTHSESPAQWREGQIIYPEARKVERTIRRSVRRGIDGALGGFPRPWNAFGRSWKLTRR